MSEDKTEGEKTKANPTKEKLYHCDTEYDEQNINNNYCANYNYQCKCTKTNTIYWCNCTFRKWIEN